MSACRRSSRRLAESAAQSAEQIGPAATPIVAVLAPRGRHCGAADRADVAVPAGVDSGRRPGRPMSRARLMVASAAGRIPLAVLALMRARRADVAALAVLGSSAPAAPSPTAWRQFALVPSLVELDAAGGQRPNELARLRPTPAVRARRRTGRLGRRRAGLRAVAAAPRPLPWSCWPVCRAAGRREHRHGIRGAMCATVAFVPIIGRCGRSRSPSSSSTRRCS